MIYIFKHRKIILIFILAAALQGCQSSIRFAANNQTKTAKSNSYGKHSNTGKEKKDSNQSPDKIDFSTGEEFTDAVINEAESWLGVPYKYGGESRSGVDCSGFVYQVYSSVGVALPRTSSQQYDFVESIDFVDKKAGDLIFFKSKSGISHVGIYLGKGYMIHSSSSVGVTRQSVHDSYYMNKMAGIGRVKINLSKND
jgi:cell wall-associated NlpC family hydrolase